MKITVRLFGRYKDIAGKEKVILDIIGGNTVGDIVDVFVRQYPVIENDKKRIMVLKNKMYVSYDTLYDEGDEISLAPPVVSGG